MEAVETGGRRQNAGICIVMGDILILLALLLGVALAGRVSPALLHGKAGRSARTGGGRRFLRRISGI